MSMKKVFAILVVLVGLTIPAIQPASATSSKEARAHVELLVTQVLSALRSKNDRMEKFGRIIFNNVDFVIIARGALGRKGRRISKDDLFEIGQLLAAIIINKAISWMDDKDIASFTISKVREMPNKDVLISSVIEFDNGQSIKAGWRVRKVDGKLYIVDIQLEGYSVRIHYLNRFGQKVSDGTDFLIKSLRGKVKGTPSEQWIKDFGPPRTTIK